MQGVAHRAVPARLRPWLALLGVAAVCAAILFLGDPAARALRYERNALLDGQAWRALTCHLVLGSWARLGADLAVAALVVAAYGRDLRASAALLCAVGTSAGLFFFALRAHTHAGPSGLLVGLVVVGALCAWRRGRRLAVLPAFPLGVLAIVAEGWTLDPFAGFGDAASVRAACFSGAAGGALAFAILYRPSRSRL